MITLGSAHEKSDVWNGPQIEQSVRETGINWKAIAELLGVSERTLHKSRIEYGIESSFTEISDSDLDNEMKEIIRLTWSFI